MKLDLTTAAIAVAVLGAGYVAYTIYAKKKTPTSPLANDVNWASLPNSASPVTDTSMPARTYEQDQFYVVGENLFGYEDTGTYDRNPNVK